LILYPFIFPNLQSTENRGKGEEKKCGKTLQVDESGFRRRRRRVSGVFLNMMRSSCVLVSVTTVFLTTGELTTVKAGSRPASAPEVFKRNVLRHFFLSSKG
jgi:hypothetical protein